MRREWIEIAVRRYGWGHTESPSMRREWIEIYEGGEAIGLFAVSLHAEGVD